MQRAESVHRSAQGSSICRIRKVLEPARHRHPGAARFLLSQKLHGNFLLQSGSVFLSPTLFKVQLYISDEYGLRFS